jgi:hypothetical protein
MEILRFEEATTTAPKRKKSSKGYLTIGFVATVFGLGSAFASNTIAINGNAPIALGQGVTIVTACDTEISITPFTAMRVVAGTPTFFMDEIQITGINSSLPDATTGLGCGGTTFDIQIFDGANNPYSCEVLKADGLAAAFIGTAQALTCVTDNKLSFPVQALEELLGFPRSNNYTISFDDAPSDISFITLVTR